MYAMTREAFVAALSSFLWVFVPGFSHNRFGLALRDPGSGNSAEYLLKDLDDEFANRACALAMEILRQNNDTECPGCHSIGACRMSCEAQSRSMRIDPAAQSLVDRLVEENAPKGTRTKLADSNDSEVENRDGWFWYRGDKVHKMIIAAVEEERSCVGTEGGPIPRMPGEGGYGLERRNDPSKRNRQRKPKASRGGKS